MANPLRQAASVAVLGLLLAAADLARAETGSVMVTPESFTWVDMPTLPAGAKIALIEGSRDTLFTEPLPFTFRLKLPADYEIPAHRHPWTEHATVMRGTLNMGHGDVVDRSRRVALPAGSVAVLQPGINHFSWTEEETIVQIHGIGPLIIEYADPSKDPRAVAAQGN